MRFKIETPNILIEKFYLTSYERTGEEFLACPDFPADEVVGTVKGAHVPMTINYVKLNKLLKEWEGKINFSIDIDGPDWLSIDINDTTALNELGKVESKLYVSYKKMMGRE